MRGYLKTDEWEALPEDQRGTYVHDEVEGGYLLPDVADYLKGLRSAIGKERDGHRTAQRELAELRNQYKDREAALNTELEELRQYKAQRDKDGDPAALRKLLKAREQSLHAVLRDQAVTEACMEHKAVPLAMRALLAGKVQVEEADNKLTAYVEHDGKRLTVSQYVGELGKAAIDKAHPLHDAQLNHLFYSRTVSGGGTPPNGTGSSKGYVTSAAAANLRRSKMTPRQKVDYVREHGEKALLDLPL
jgi:hypothetical protein